MIKSILQQKKICCSLFLNGELLELIERRCAVTTAALRQLVRSKRLELLGASFYDSQLALLHPFSRSAQIEKMTSQQSRMVRKRPLGFWPDLGIWDPALPVHLHQAGLRYAFLSTRQLRRYQPARLFSPLITSEQGRSVLIFPLHSDLLFDEHDAFLSPEALLNKILALQKKIPRRHEASTVFISCLLNGQNPLFDYHWFQKFFYLLEQEGIVTELPRNYLQEYQQGGTPTPGIAISCSNLNDLPLNPSLGEHLKNNDSLDYRQGLVLLPQSQLLLHRFNYTQLLVNQLRGDRQRRKEALDLLWRGGQQRNYLPLSEGGITAPINRQNCYRHLIRSEKLCRQQAKPSLASMDYNLDGVNEYVFRGRSYNAVIQRRGGSILEWEDLVGERSLTSLFSAANATFSPSCFSDRLIVCRHHRQTLNKVNCSDQFQQDLAERIYQLEKCRGDQRRLTLSTTVRLPYVNETTLLSKSYLFDNQHLTLTYHLTRANHEQSQQLFFSTDLNLSLPIDALFLTRDPYGQQLSSKVCQPLKISSLASFSLVSPSSQSQLQIQFSQPLQLDSQPIYNFHNTSQRSQIYFQGIHIRCCWLVEADWLHQGRLTVSCRSLAYSSAPPCQRQSLTTDLLEAGDE